MQVRILTASLALVIGCGALGCKSAPKMAWWSSSKDSKVESTAVAHAAPQLPSEVAKQTEGVNSADPVQISSAPAFAANSSNETGNSTGAAPAYTATASPSGAYPSTGAQSYVPATNQATLPASSTTALTSAMPYNPNAVPAPKSDSKMESVASSAILSNSPAVEDRYGSFSTQTTSQALASAPATGTASSPTNGLQNSNSTSDTAATPYAGTNSLGDRYAMPNSPTQETKDPVTKASAEPQQVQAASAIASTEPYRPGGTSTYPGIAASNAQYEVATRPAVTSSSTTNVPNVAYPSTGTNQYR